MVLKKSKIKIPYIRLNFRIVRQSDVRCCERTAVSHRLLLDFIFFFVFLVLLKAHFISSISSNFDYSELVMLK